MASRGAPAGLLLALAILWPRCQRNVLEHCFRTGTLVFKNGALNFIRRHLCSLPLLPARKVGVRRLKRPSSKTGGPGREEGPGPWAAGSGRYRVVVGRPALLCPEAHCPKVQRAAAARRVAAHALARLARCPALAARCAPSKGSPLAPDGVACRVDALDAGVAVVCALPSVVRGCCPVLSSSVVMTR